MHKNESGLAKLAFKLGDIWRYLGIWLLPKALLSRLMGRFAELTSPKKLVSLQVKSFSRIFDVNMAESALPLESFVSLQDFFTRRLKPGARSIDKSRNAVTSPCDGFWGSSGQAQDGKALQIKGKFYQLTNLLGLPAESQALANCNYATFYLSPRDYHRFHSPIDGHVVAMTYIPGALWPVNDWAVRCVENLFCVNERVVMTISPLNRPSEHVYLVAVAATNVGKIHVEFGRDVLTKPQKYLHRTYGPDEYFFAQGQELGHFMFGSTLVMVAKPTVLELEAKAMGNKVILGERIGKTMFES